MNIQTQMAEQQLLGFAMGKCDARINDLVSSVGLKESEWLEIKASGLLHLDHSDIESIDEYFASQNGSES